MEFFEEVTRHRLRHGILPLEKLYTPGELDALTAAYLAWLAGWVEGFSRTILLLDAALTLGLLYGSRLLLSLWRPKPVLAEKQA